MIITTLFLAATTAAFVHTTWYTITTAAVLGILMLGQATGRRLARMSAALDERALDRHPGADAIVRALACAWCGVGKGQCTCTRKCIHSPLCGAPDTAVGLFTAGQWAEFQDMCEQAGRDYD